ncbi:filamentous hemagglutinin N-terminal domain-containing protein, partial [Spirulina subsalsa FACHB-351]
MFKNALVVSSGFFLGLLNFNASLQAQIVADTTLPNNTAVNCLGFTCTITQGTTMGNNLFHSFKQFSVPLFNTAQFQHNPAINTVIGRVTGGLPSEINGFIQAAPTNPNFNLFLLNPNGIIFGPNASLNFNGSFTAATGTGIVFSDGTIFPATGDNPPLTMSVPVGIQRGTNPGSIQLQGANLILPVGNNLSLVGGDIILSETLNFGLPQFATISTTQGNITLDGRNIILTGGSSVGVPPTFDQPGGRLTVRASESVQISGTSALSANIRSGFYAQNVGGIADAGNINIFTPLLVLENGGVILTSTVGAGNAGNTVINAENVVLRGVVGDRPSGIYSESGLAATGDAGNITVNGGNISLADGARISTSTDVNSLGKAGTVSLKGDLIEVVGSQNGIPSLITSQTLGNSDAGNLNIVANQMRILNGGQVLGKSERQGKAGNIDLTVGVLELNQNALLSVETNTAQGGNIFVRNSQLLTLANNSKISASTQSGQGGNIEVLNGNRINLGGNSEIIAQSTGIGRAGDVTLEGRVLNITNNAQVSVSNTGTGNAGNLGISASEIKLNQGKLSAETRQGAGGNVLLRNMRSLFLENQSQ